MSDKPKKIRALEELYPNRLTADAVYDVCEWDGVYPLIKDNQGVLTWLHRTKWEPADAPSEADAQGLEPTGQWSVGKEFERLRAERDETRRVNGLLGDKLTDATAEIADLKKQLEAAQAAAIDKDALRAALLDALGHTRILPDASASIRDVIARFCPAPVKFEPVMVWRVLKIVDHADAQHGVYIASKLYPTERRDCGEYFEYWTTEPKK